MAKDSVSRQAPLSKEQLLEYAADLFGDRPDNLKHVVEHICQQVLEAEITEHLGAEAHQRTPERRGHRNGYKPRTLNTRVGTLRLSVPQARDGSFSTMLFDNYQRSEKAVCSALMETVIQGVSTRKVKKITRLFCGTTFSASTVSNLVKSLDGELEAFRNRPLSGRRYLYLLADARYEQVRTENGVVSQAILLVAGVSEDGYREILAVEIADLESESTWRDVFRRLKERGLSGVEYIVSDDHKGMKKAIRSEFAGALWQRCQVHFKKNLMGRVKPREKAQISRVLDFIWDAGSLSEARDRTRQIVDIYQSRKPRVADYLESNIEDTLAVMALPEHHRVKMATNNLMERLSQAVKQRTRVVRIFPNEASSLRLITAILLEIHEDWVTGYRYLKFSKNKAEESASDSNGIADPQEKEVNEKIEQLLLAEAVS